MTTTDLETAALWAALPADVQSHAWTLMITKRPYEALRVIIEATGSAPRGRALVAWLAQVVIKEER